MRDGRPQNLKEMLAEAKDTSELMVDLSYAALFYNSEDISEEVFRLEERLNDLVYDMRTLAILAARSPADSEQMAGILQVVQDIEKIGNAANDIAKIVVKRLGIPRELLQDIPIFQGHGSIRAQQRAVKIHNKKPARFSTILRVGYWVVFDSHIR